MNRVADQDSSPLTIHLAQVPATLRNVVAQMAQGRIPEAGREDFLAAHVAASCQRCRTKLSPSDLLRLGLGESAETIGDERLARVLRGYCANEGCLSLYYLFFFRSHPAVDWSGVEAMPEAAPTRAPLEPAVEETVDPEQQAAERRASRRRALKQALVVLLVLLLLVLAGWWRTGRTIPLLREPRQFTVAPQPVAPPIPPPGKPASTNLPAASEIVLDPELPDLTKIKPDPDVRKKK